MHRIFVIFLFIIFASDGLFAQKKGVIDSLENALKTAKDTAKVEILLKLCWESRNAEFNHAIAYGNEARALAEKYNYPRQLSTSYNFLGVVYRNIGNYSRSMQMFLEGKKVAEKNNDLTEVAYSENNIGDIMRQQGNLRDAEKRIKKAEDIFRALNDSVGLAYALLRMTEVYFERKRYDDAQKFVFECINIRKRQNNEGGLQSAYNRVGKIYLAQKNYILAFEYLHASLSISSKMGDRRSIISSKIDIGKVHYSLNSLDSAAFYADAALLAALKSGSKHLTKDSYLLHAKVAHARGDNTKAYEFQAKYAEVYEEILGESTQRAIESMQFTYDLEKKQTELDLLNKEKQVSNTIQTATGIVVFLLFLFVLFLVKNIKERNAVNRSLQEKNAEISSIADTLSLANQEITEQKVLLDKKNQAITDSLNYAKRIQATILPSRTYFKKFIPEMFVFFRPKDIVSGDFYWFHENISEGGSKIVLVAADCTGHGVPGAFMSLIGATLLNKIVKDAGNFCPYKILQQLDIAIQQDLRQKDTGNMDGMDAAVVMIDLEEQKLYFSGAKNPLFCVQNGEIIFVKGSKFSVGGDYSKHSYEIFELDLKNSLTDFYIYSDGFQDQFGGKSGKKFMSKNFRQLLWDIHKESSEKQLEMLKTALFDFQGKENQVDDVLVIGCRLDFVVK